MFDSVQKLSIPFQKNVGILPRELDHKLRALGRRFNGSRTLLATDRDQKIKPAVFDHLLCERFDGRQAGFHRSRRLVRRCCTHGFPFYQALLFTATCFLGADLADPEAGVPGEAGGRIGMRRLMSTCCPIPTMLAVR